MKSFCFSGFSKETKSLILGRFSLHQLLCYANIHKNLVHGSFAGSIPFWAHMASPKLLVNSISPQLSASLDLQSQAQPWAPREWRIWHSGKPSAARPENAVRQQKIRDCTQVADILEFVLAASLRFSVRMRYFCFSGFSKERKSLGLSRFSLHHLLC